MCVCVCVCVYNSSPLSPGVMFQDPQWMPKTAHSTEPYVYYVFFLYIHTCDNV